MAVPTITATGQGVTASDLATLTLTSFDCAGGAALVVFVGIRSNAAQAVTGVTYNGVALTQHSLTAGTFGRLYSFWMVNPASGAHDLVVSCDATDRIIAFARALDGAHATAPCRAHNETIDTTATGDAISVSSSTFQAGDLCLDCCQVITGTNPTMTADAGQDNAVTLTASSHKLATSSESGVGAVTMGWSGWTNLRCRIVIVPIAPAAGAGGTGGSGLMLMGVG